MMDISRRELLGAAATAGAAGLSGCLDGLIADSADDPEDGADGDDDSNDDTGDDADSDDGTADSDDGTANGPPSVVDYGTETTNRDCLSGEEDAQFAIAQQTVRLTGTMTAPNPCHEASVERVAVADGELSVVMAPDEGDGEGGCAGCVGGIEHETTVELTTLDGLKRVVLTYENGGEYTYDVVDTASAAPASTIRGSSIETVETRCASGEVDAAATERDGTVVIDGILGTPDPCHRAVLDSASVDAETLVVVVGAESVLDDDEVCQQCTGHVDYRAEIDFDGDVGISTVEVRHPGHTFTVSWNSTSGGR